MAQQADTQLEKIVNAVSKGTPVYLFPYEEPKVWGVKGIGEYWYGAEAQPKSSTAVIGEDRCPMAEVLARVPGAVLGGKAIGKFGHMLPLVKILTPKGRLSVQFHDAKNELWIVTGTNSTVAGGEPKLIVGFSRRSVDGYGEKVTEKYGEALREYGKVLNALIDKLEADKDGKAALDRTKDVRKAAEELKGKIPALERSLGELDSAQTKLESFYNYFTVGIGDVVPIPSGTLHALGPGVEVVEPQIAGPTQSLEDGTTYPVRYYFPGFERPGAQKKLDIDRVDEMNPAFTPKTHPEVINEAAGCVTERLPGNFEDKGLEVHRISMSKGATLDQLSLTSFHDLVCVKGKAELLTGEMKYEIPKAVSGGEMLLVPASAGSYTITALEDTQLIDTFTPTS